MPTTRVRNLDGTEQDPAQATGNAPAGSQASGGTQPDPLGSLGPLAALVDRYKAPDPTPHVGVDPALAQDTHSKLAGLQALQGLVGLRHVTAQSFKHGNPDTTPQSSPGYEAARGLVSAPLEAQQAGAQRQNDYMDTLAKFRLAQQQGIEKAGASVLGNENRGLGVAQIKAPTEAAKVEQSGKNATTGADARVKAAEIAAGARKYATDHPAPKAGAEEPPPLDPAALDQVAEMFHQTGTLPPMGMGKAGAATRTAIINRAAQMHPAANLAGNKADYGANVGSLKAIQKNSDAIDAFDKTASANFDRFIGAMKQVSDTGSPLLNKPLRWFTGSVLGDPKVAALHAARQAAVNEIAKIISNPTLAGQLSDSARHEVASFSPQEATLEQTLAVAKVLRADADARRAATHEQTDAIRGRLGGGKPAFDPAAYLNKKKGEP